MSTITKDTSITLDGSTKFKLGSDTYKWGDFWGIDAYVSTAAIHTVAYDLKGKDWNVGTLSFSGNGKAVITDHTTVFDSVWIDGITLYNTGPNVVTLENAGVGVINGGGGADTISIGNWADAVLLGRGEDKLTLTGNGGADLASMGRDDDIVNLKSGWVLGVDMGRANDTVIVGKGNFDAIELGRDADTIKFGADTNGNGYIGGGEDISDDLAGAKDFDTLDFSALTKALTVDFAARSASSADFDFQIKNFEKVVGGSKGDKLYGSSDADTLDGGAGNDMLNGRGGADTFVFKTGYDADTIDGFTAKGAGHDVINISFKAIKSFDDLKPLMANDHGSAVIDFGHGDTLTLTGVAVKNLIEADFSF